MQTLIIIISLINTTLFLIHELDAVNKKEWRMFKYLQRFSDKTQYYIFLYAHLPLILFMLYYLWSVLNFNNYIMFLIVNLFSVFHLIIHIIALKWKSNVFSETYSLLIIIIIGTTGVINLLLNPFY